MRRWRRYATKTRLCQLLFRSAATFVMFIALLVCAPMAAFAQNVPVVRDAEIEVTRDGQTVGGTSIMGLMMLAAGQGSSIVVEVSGPQATEALAAITALVEDGFGEEC